MSHDPTLPMPLEPGQRRLKRGDVLGGRFTIIQFLAEGGMGEVYEAADLHLQNKHYALKTLRPEIAAKPELRMRFEREVLLAREVNHPNVCPTYDIFHVQGPNGSISFLTMRLLRGESLLARMKRLGRFEPEALEPIAKQMADALDAAHRVGVIHRDFKPGNVMVDMTTPEMRVSITDFGLSRAYEADATLAETGQVLGTPGYIAPELIQGRIAAFTADVYAFGVVLYEMATGKKPVYESDKPGIVRPSALAPDLPPVWEKIILGCLDPNPATRFQSAGEALSLLPAPKSGASSRTVRVPMTPRRVWLAATIAVVVAAVVGWFTLPNLDSFLHPLPAKRFVALMAWPANTDTANRPLLKNVLDTIGSRLARAETSTKDLLIISQNDVTGSTLTAPVDAVGALGANLVLAGAVRGTGDGVTVDLAVLDAASSKELRKTSLNVSASDLNLLPDRAAVSAAKLLDVSLSPDQWKDPDGLASVKPAAYPYFTRAEDLIALPNNAGLDEAIEQYRNAIDADPAFSLAYAKLAMAFTAKYQREGDPAALSVAEKNADLALRYNPGSAKAVLSRATVDRLSGRIQPAIDGIQRALQLDPGNPRTLLDKAFAFRFLGRRVEEQNVYKEILKDRPNFWPAYEELGFSFSREGKYQEAASAFAEGSAVAPRVAVLLANLGAMHLYLDHKKDAEEAFRKSLDRAPNETAFLNLGTLAFAAGDYRKALEYYNGARGINPRSPTTMRNIADCYAMLGDSARVTESYSKAAELAREILRTNPVRGATWMNLAFYEAKLGHAAEADAALKNAEARGSSDIQSQFKRVQVLFLLGHQEDALRLLLECLKNGLSQTDVDLALDLKELRNDPRYRRAVAELRK